MKLKLILIGLAVFCTSQNIVAQALGYFNDALLFSQTNFGGSARIQAIGGAQVALGGDQSLAASNPAGLGFFNRSTFSFTPAFDFHNADTDYLGTRVSNYRNRFNIAQLGVVFNNSKGDIVQDKFKGGSFAITLNRVNNFNNEIRYEGVNQNNSIVDSFIENAGNVPSGNLGGLEASAFNHFLIDEADWDNRPDYIFNVDGNRTYIVPNIVDGTIEGYAGLVGNQQDILPRQSEVIRTSGAQYQLNLSWGGNYDDRLYFGGGIGLQTVDYRLERVYTEDEFTLSDESLDDLLNSIVIRDEFDVSGVGINGTFGLIARPIDYVTVGVSYTTPTFYSLNEETSFSLTTDWNSNYSYVTLNSQFNPSDTIALGRIVDESDIGITDYELRSPSRLNVGAAVFIGKNGFISGDLEFVDYSNAHIKSNNFSPTADNQEIDALYRSVVNYRLGAEWRIDQFRLRGGYSFQDDPYSANDGLDRSVKNVSFGVGFREKNYFVDLAVINSSFKSFHSPYFVNELSPMATANNTTTRAMVTVGFTF